MCIPSRARVVLVVWGEGLPVRLAVARVHAKVCGEDDEKGEEENHDKEFHTGSASCARCGTVT